MGIQMALLKENNHLFFDFTDAYWVVEKVKITTSPNDIEAMVSFDFSAYPSRTAKKAAEELLQPQQFAFGGPEYNVTLSRLYRWAGAFKASDVFPGGIPTTKDGQLELLYPFIKGFLGLTDVIDILEEET